MNKYRAWDKEKKKMITDDLFISSDGDVYELANTNYDTPHTEIERLGNIILMQSTGLKDKNGVEIFEGDVLVEGYGFYLVTWLKEESRFMLTAEDFCLPMTSARNMKVCGNKYANPELLKEVE